MGVSHTPGAVCITCADAHSFWWPRVLGLVAAVVLAVQVQAEGVPEVSEKFDIAAVPTFVFLAVRGCLPLARGAVLACLNGRLGRAGRSSASKKVPMPQCWRRTS